MGTPEGGRERFNDPNGSSMRPENSWFAEELFDRVLRAVVNSLTDMERDVSERRFQADR